MDEVATSGLQSDLIKLVGYVVRNIAAGIQRGQVRSRAHRGNRNIEYRYEMGGTAGGEQRM